jgi:hypothetical protein
MSAFDQLDKLLYERAYLTRVFSVLKPLCREPMPKATLAALRDYFKFKDRGLSCASHIADQPDFLYGADFDTYQSWFTRPIKKEYLDKLKAGAKNSKIALPNECVIESIGTVGDTESILRLKKPAPDALRDLMHLGVPADYSFVNMKLLTSHYHHIHSPVEGVITRALPIHKEMPMFGRASINFLEIDSTIGKVFLLIIGEAVVQDFDYAVTVGQNVSQLDPIGNFNWGSQVVMLMPKITDSLRVESRNYYFVGSRVD